MCIMKTAAITIFTLLFMISFTAVAGGDGSKGTHPKGKTEATPTETSIESSTNLIVINLNDNGYENGLPEDILKQFRDVIDYPEDVQNAEEEECVLDGFSYDDDGYIRVENTRSSNDSFSKHVVSNIEKIRLRDGSVTIGKQYFAKFSFKKL